MSSEVNWRIHDLFVRNRIAECSTLIERHLGETSHKAEYALYVKGLIKRAEGQMVESLDCFMAASKLNPDNVSNLKQTARSYYLMGQHSRALAMYDKARRAVEAMARVDRKAKLDWEIWHNMALCELYLGNGEAAEKRLQTANSITRNERTYKLLAKLYLGRGDTKAASNVLVEGLDFAPDDDDLMCSRGLLLLATGSSSMAFDCFGKSLSHNPRQVDAILAMGAVMQSSGDVDAALSKYRTAAAVAPQCAELWSNIGMCFVAKSKHVVGIACLRRALALAPLEWIIVFNLGLVHIATDQFASAFTYLNAALSLKPDSAAALGLLGVVLMRLGDSANAFAAYERALQVAAESSQPEQTMHFVRPIRLNYAVALFSAGQSDAAKAQLDLFQPELDAWQQSEDAIDPAVVLARDGLRAALLGSFVGTASQPTPPSPQ